MKRELETANDKLSASKLDGMIANAVSVKGVKLVLAKLNDNPNNARSLGDKIKAEYPDSVTLIAVIGGDKLNFVCACGKDAVAAGAHAGMLCKAVSAICGGNGGGRPDSAMSGAKDVSKVDIALSSAESILADMIK